ncbi:MAG: phage tail sheath family protein, partial [Spirochaetales bacterium]|nr:phage tail sheath family protein [Spirochaetales bacterium]
MRRYIIPGVYIEPALKKIESIKITKKCLVGFIGLAEKGPLHEPIKITHFKEFLNIFGGFTHYAYLAHAVFGFFNCGGKECIVVRTAHLTNNENDEAETKNSAAKAFLLLKDSEANDALTIAAQSEGMWGDEIQVKLWYAPDVTTKMKDKAASGSTTLQVHSTEDLNPGDCLCIYGNDKKEYRRLSSVEGTTIRFTSPLRHEYDSEKEQIFCEKLLVNLLVIHKKTIEEYLYLSLNPDSINYYINEINDQSELITLKETLLPNDEHPIPEEVFFKNLNSGRNGILGLTPADFIGYFKGLNNYKGIGVFEAFDEMALIVSPDLIVFQELIYKQDEKKQALDAIFAVQSAMINQCELMGNRFAILDTPLLDNPVSLLKWRDKFDTKYAALYYPRIEMINPEDPRGLRSMLIPSSGHIAGSYVDCDVKEGIFRAPANKFISGIVGVEHIIENDLYEMFYPKGINCMKYVPGRGVKVWGARTLSSDPVWRYINVRRTFSAIRDSIKQGTGWAVFEPNTPGLRKRIVRHVSAFLLDLWRKGYMSGNTPEDGYYVKCDDELNPPEEVESGRIQIEIGISIARPAEFLVVKLTANKDDG